MDLNRGLITKIVDENNFRQVQRSGLTTQFLDDDFIAVFNYVERHWIDYKDTPSRDAILAAFPNFEFGDYKEPLEYFVDSLKESFRRNVLEDKLFQVASVYKKNTEEAASILRGALSEIQVTHKSVKDVNLSESALDRLEAYDFRKANPGVDGIPSNWPTLDYQTLGWHEEEFTVLVGEKYVGKSWALVWLALQAMIHGERVLFVTKEMSQTALSKRFDAIYAGVNYDSLRRGELSHVEEERYKNSLTQFSGSNYYFTIAREGVNTIEDIERKAVETDSTIIFGDSIYLFAADSRSENLGETERRRRISTKCKGIARSLGVPFIVSVQAGRKKTQKREVNLDVIEWSNAFSQDADTVIFTDKDDLDRELNRSQMYVLKSREGNLASFFYNQDFNYMKFDERTDEAEPTTSIEFDDDDAEDTLYAEPE